MIFCEEQEKGMSSKITIKTVQCTKSTQRPSSLSNKQKTKNKTKTTIINNFKPLQNYTKLHKNTKNKLQSN